MRPNNNALRLTNLFVLVVGIALRIVAASHAEASVAGEAVAQSQPDAAACVAPAADAPIRVWRDGRFAGP